ncbi:MAG: hypothetical protein AAFV87_04460 [Pseudomonadota bacterium]
MRRTKNRIASYLAVLIAAAIMTSGAKAESVVLPQSASDPIVLPLNDGTSATSDPSDQLQVFVGSADACCDGRTPIAGRYAEVDNAIAFTPAFGFDPGQDYVARAQTHRGDLQLVPFRILSETVPTEARITEIFPSGDTLPENVLRFYIHFSAPMKPHVAFEYIKLRDASGAVDHAAFMRFKQELWNADRTRLTVLIDPGRIKRNVATNVELGPALLEGQDYILSIEGGWPSADGTSRLPGFSKRFTVGAPLRVRPDVENWEVTSPCAGTKGSLYIMFDRPFDRHLLSQEVRVTNESGRDIDGAFIVGGGQQSLIFTPSEPWSGDEIQIVVSPELEDVAANNFRDLLDHLGSDSTHVSSTVLRISVKNCGD